jgi:hypothetical protein
MLPGIPYLPENFDSFSFYFVNHWFFAFMPPKQKAVKHMYLVISFTAKQFSKTDIA